MPKTPTSFYNPPTFRIPNRLRLDLNENLFPAPGGIAELMPSVQEPDLKFYAPDVIRACERGFAAKLGTAPERLFFNHGSAEILKQIFLSLGRTDRPVVLCRPSWPYYESLCSILQLKVKSVYLSEAGSRFVFPTDELFATESLKPSLIVINSPHMPTGSVMGFDSLCELAAAMPDTLIVLDQAYWGFSPAYRLEAERNLDSYLSELPNLIVVRTMSKFFGLAGVRVGYGLGNEVVVEQLRKFGPLFGLSSPAMKFALTAMEHYEYYKALSREVEEQREALLRFFNAHEHFCAYESDGNFILVRCLRGETKEVMARLDEIGLIVRPCETYGLSDCFRITIAESKTMNAVISAVEQIEI